MELARFVAKSGCAAAGGSMTRLVLNDVHRVASLTWSTSSLYIPLRPPARPPFVLPRPPPPHAAFTSISILPRHISSSHHTRAAMLFHPLVLQGIAVLKALLLLTAGPAATQDAGVFGRRTIGAFIFTMALVSTPTMLYVLYSCRCLHSVTLNASIYNAPGDLPLYKLMVPPPMDLIASEPISDILLDISPERPFGADAGDPPLGASLTACFNRTLTDDATEVVPPSAVVVSVSATKSRTANVPMTSKLVPSPFGHLRIPEIDWSNPGVPTVKAKKAKKMTPKGIHVDLFFIDFYFSPKHGLTFPQELLKLFVWNQAPTAPDDDTPRLWQYETPELKCRQLCLRKGLYSSLNSSSLGSVLALRTFALGYTLWVVGSWILPIPRYIRKAWRAWKRSQRPLRIRRRRLRDNRR